VCFDDGGVWRSVAASWDHTTKVLALARFAAPLVLNSIQSARCGFCVRELRRFVPSLQFKVPVPFAHAHVHSLPISLSVFCIAAFRSGVEFARSMYKLLQLAHKLRHAS